MYPITQNPGIGPLLKILGTPFGNIKKTAAPASVQTGCGPIFAKTVALGQNRGSGPIVLPITAHRLQGLAAGYRE